MCVFVDIWLRPDAVQKNIWKRRRNESGLHENTKIDNQRDLHRFVSGCDALYSEQSFAFGQYQVRIATALYGLSYIFPFLVVPFGIANVISNLVMGGLGPVDAIGGFFMGVLTSGVIAMGRRYGLGCWIVAVAVTLLPGLGVPVWLSGLLLIPYVVLVASLLVGQFISGITGMLLVRALEKADVANLCFRTNRSRN